jgi:hypothetical protein
MKLKPNITRAQIVTAMATAIEGKESFVRDDPRAKWAIDALLAGGPITKIMRECYPHAEWKQAAANIAALRPIRDPANEPSYVIAMADRFERLAGCTIQGETIVDVEGNRWGLHLVTEDGEMLDMWIQSDPECNGPGFLDVRYTDTNLPFIR